jgi:hypothetical protein
MTFATAMNLEFDGVKAETDLVALWRKENHDFDAEPALIIGETKSLGQGTLLKAADLAKLKAIAGKLPGAFVVVSVLRDHFTDEEKALVKPFVQWGRRVNADGEATNTVILLTTHELFVDHFISATWKELGDPHKSFSDYNYTRNRTAFGDATQQIYLGMPSYHSWREAGGRRDRPNARPRLGRIRVRSR